MGTHRAFHTTWYILYLITFLIFLWFFLRYAGVSSWVFWLFFAGIIIIGIGVLQKETLMRKRVREDGTEYCHQTRYNWTIAYSVFHFIALGLIITGLVFVILESSIPWWVWMLLFLSFIFSIIGTMIHTYSPNARAWAAVTHIIALGLGLTAFVFLISTSNSPYWVWLIYALAILFAVLAGSFEQVSDKNHVVVADKCEQDCADVLLLRSDEDEFCDEDCEIASPCKKKAPCAKPCAVPAPCDPCHTKVVSSKPINVTNGTTDIPVSNLAVVSNRSTVSSLPTIEIAEQQVF